MKVVITELNWPIGVELLKEKGWEVVYDPVLWKNRSKLRQELKLADAIIVRNQTKVDAELLGWEHQIKVIGRLGVGLDNIDLQTAADKKITVVFGKNANATSVAEYVIAAVFQSARLLQEAAADVRKGGWNRKKFTGTELAGKTLGLIGVGEIGHRTAVRAKALGMNVIGYDPFVAPYDFPIAVTGIRPASLDTVIEQSDFISLHVPLTAQTRNLINKETLAKMKHTAVLINTSRGGIINESDLDAALHKGIISGAVLDVLEQEPPDPSHPLLQMENCIITPHIAGLTEESQVRTAEMVSKEVINELEGRISLCRVNVRK
jgi:D-3-phosphoglycerate dehydrogenase